MNARLAASLVLLTSTFAADAQCSIDLPQDTVTLYWGYDPMACATLAPAVNGASPVHLVWSNGSTENTIQVCDTTSGWYAVTLTDDTLCPATDSVFVNVVDVHCGNNNDKVLVCHIPPGNPANAHTICISANGVPAHLAHGCHLGACAAVVDTADGQAGLILAVTPNPMTTEALVTVRSLIEQRVQVRVIDPMGRRLGTLLDATMAENGSLVLTLDDGQLPSGISLVWIEAVGDQGRIAYPVVVQR